jgi:hypothetical protein
MRVLIREAARAIVAMSDEVADVAHAVATMQVSAEVKKNPVKVVMPPLATGNGFHSKMYVCFSHL